MVDVWEATRKKFSVDEQRHYLFTPRDLTAWLRGLLRYELIDPNPNPIPDPDPNPDPEPNLALSRYELVDQHEAVYETWAFEANRVLRDRLVSRQDRARFDSIVSSALRSHFNHALEDEEITYSPLLVGALSG